MFFEIFCDTSRLNLYFICEETGKVFIRTEMHLKEKILCVFLLKVISDKLFIYVFIIYIFNEEGAGEKKYENIYIDATFSLWNY